MQASPSSHAAVFAGFEQAPVALSQTSSVHGLASEQPFFAPGWHALLPHTSPTVQTSSSLHCAVLGADEQAPVAALQLSLVQPFLSSQLLAGPPTQAPWAQVSPTVQALPSSHLAELPGCWQSPVLPSHLSSVHGWLSLQSLVVPAAHLPALHTSLSVHGSPSSQVVVSGLWAHAPVPSSQVSAVQIWPSSQFGAGPAAHAPPSHVSPSVHFLPSSQGAELAPNAHFPPTQALVVHGFLSSQSAGLSQLPPHPGIGLLAHFPLAESHASAVHASLSAQACGVPA